jgi:hypothetical protein
MTKLEAGRLPDQLQGLESGEEEGTRRRKRRNFNMGTGVAIAC